MLIIKFLLNYGSLEEKAKTVFMSHIFVNIALILYITNTSRNRPLESTRR